MDEALEEVAYVTADEELIVRAISRCAVSIARAQGWMVLSDFTREPFNAPRVSETTDVEGDGA